MSRVRDVARLSPARSLCLTVLPFFLTCLLLRLWQGPPTKLEIQEQSAISIRSSPNGSTLAGALGFKGVVNSFGAKGLEEQDGAQSGAQSHGAAPGERRISGGDHGAMYVETVRLDVQPPP